MDEAIDQGSREEKHGKQKMGSFVKRGDALSKEGAFGSFDELRLGPIVCFQVVLPWFAPYNEKFHRQHIRHQKGFS